MILDTPISAFRTATDTVPTTVRLGQFLNSRKHVSDVLAVRQAPDKSAREELKKRLPGATISGIFRRRSAAEIETYNGLVCLDFDAQDNPDITAYEMRARLSEYAEVAYCGLSVSGRGCFAIVPTTNTDPAAHPRVVEAIARMFFQAEGLVADKACKDVSRLRFISYDPEAHLNTAAGLLDVAPLLTIDTDAGRRPRPIIIRDTPGNTQSDDTTRAKVEEYIAAIEGSALDVTDNYEDWIKLGLAIANEFGMDGEDYFQRISYFHPRYDHAQTAKKYANLYRQNKGKIRIGTFFQICRIHGIKL